MEEASRGERPSVGAGALRAAVIGAGLVAQAVHVPLLRRAAGFEPVALAEPSSALRCAVAGRWAIPAAYADHRVLLERERPDVVVVCSPNGTHADVVLDALDAGAHVLVEKPLCIDPADADRIAAASARSGRVVQVGYMKRSDPAVRRLLDAVGRAGELRHLASLTHDPGMRAHFAAPDMPQPVDVPATVTANLARRTAEQAAQALGDEDPALVRPFVETFLGALVHDVDLGLAVLDGMDVEVERVADAFGRLDGTAAGATLELRGGARWTLAWLLVEAVVDFRETATVVTSTGIHALEFPAPYVLHAPTRYEHRAGSQCRVATSWQEAYEGQLDRFHASVTRGAPCVAPVAEARRHQALVVELFRAAALAGVPA